MNEYQITRKIKHTGFSGEIILELTSARGEKVLANIVSSPDETLDTKSQSLFQVAENLEKGSWVEASFNAEPSPGKTIKVVRLHLLPAERQGSLVATQPAPDMDETQSAA